LIGVAEARAAKCSEAIESFMLLQDQPQVKRVAPASIRRRWANPSASSRGADLRRAL